jgi:hypothetical protein
MRLCEKCQESVNAPKTVVGRGSLVNCHLTDASAPRVYDYGDLIYAKSLATTRTNVGVNSDD